MRYAPPRRRSGGTEGVALGILKRMAAAGLLLSVVVERDPGTSAEFE
jgi:hypothetical protein